MNDLVMLATLLDGPLHGYAIKKQAGLIFGRAAMHNNVVYPLLRRFVTQGWVTQRETAGDRGQRRQVYSLTARGRHALIGRLSAFDESDARSPEAFQLRVGLFAFFDPEVREQILTRRKSYLADRSEKLGRIEREMEIGRFGGEVVHFMQLQIRSEIDWIGHLESLASREEKPAGRKRRSR